MSINRTRRFHVFSPQSAMAPIKAMEAMKAMKAARAETPRKPQNIVIPMFGTHWERSPKLPKILKRYLQRRFQLRRCKLVCLAICFVTH